MCAGFGVWGVPMDVMFPAAEILQVNSHSMCRRVNKAPSRVSLLVEGENNILRIPLDDGVFLL